MLGDTTVTVGVYLAVGVLCHRDLLRFTRAMYWALIVQAPRSYPESAGSFGNRDLESGRHSTWSKAISPLPFHLFALCLSIPTDYFVR